MKFLFDLFPVILFFVAFKAYDIFIATAVAIAAVILQISWLWVRYRQVEKMMWLNLFIIIVFGGATLAFQDETFIKWKPTVLYWLIAAILLISNLIFRKNLIQVMLEKQMTVPGIIWNKLNMSWVVFFLSMGCINLFVAFNFTIDTWVTFKLFGATGLMLAFIVVQVLMLGKHLKDEAQVLVINERDDFTDKRTNKD
ncbi:MAG: septation protein A [Nitrosomonas sp. PRO4]|nr:septation protein A [Nitrosomonas sp. PRO4]